MLPDRGRVIVELSSSTFPCRFDTGGAGSPILWRSATKWAMTLLAWCPFWHAIVPRAPGLVRAWRQLPYVGCGAFSERIWLFSERAYPPGSTRGCSLPQQRWVRFDKPSSVGVEIALLQLLVFGDRALEFSSDALVDACHSLVVAEKLARVVRSEGRDAVHAVA